VDPLTLGVGLVALLGILGGGKKKKKGSGFEEKKQEVKPKPKPDDHAKNSGKVPNITGDAAGYNTTMFPDSETRDEWGQVLGYTFPDPEEIVNFQIDYNKVARNPDWPTVRGKLAEDTIPGPQTLAAMEIAATTLGVPFSYAVAGGPPP